MATYKNIDVVTPTEAGGSLLIDNLKLLNDYAPKTNSTTSNPTVTDDVDSGYYIFSKWCNTTTDDVFICADNTSGAAVWKEISSLGTKTVEAVTTTPHTVTAIESDTTYTNQGATSKIVHTLPTAVAGLRFDFICSDTDGIRVTAASGDTIRLGTSVTKTAGYVESTTIGSVICLIAIDATQWFATSMLGNWTIEIS